MHIREHAKEIARLMAGRSDSRFDFRHGAAIIKNSKIIAVGHNYADSRSFGNQTIFTVHAEIDAINHTNIRALRGATMVLYAEQHKGRVKCSRPCPNCFQIMRKLGFKRVIYSTPEGWKKENF